MLIHYYQSESFINKLRTGPAGSYMDGFADTLWKAGYAEITARRHIWTAQHLANWAQRQSVPLANMDDAFVERFKRHLPQCQCPNYGCYDHNGLVAGAVLFLEQLRRVNVLTSHVDSQCPEKSSLLNTFSQWMRVNRNISEATLYNYSLAVRDLLRAMGDDPSCYDAQRLRSFVLKQSSHCGRAKAKTMVTALRAFLRFLISEGLCPLGLDAAIPTIAYWHLSSLPQYLQTEEVEKVVNACNPNTAVGIRDRAILLLLARLALRAGDIVRLRLDDIDWTEGSIRVCGKGRREDRLPLLQEVGEAIAAYVTGSRPSADSATLFLRSRAPFRGFVSHCAVSVIVKKAMRKAGITCPVRGAAHLLRHSAATAMLREGASLQDIAVVLRHRSIETTSIYAKVDVLALREIAQPWPEEVDLC